MEQIAISIEEAARSLSISRAHAFRLAATGELPTIKLGRRVLVPLKALDRLSEQKTPLAAAQ